MQSAFDCENNGVSFGRVLRLKTKHKVKQKFDISTDHKVFLADETGTEVDEDVFADIIEQKPDTLWMVIDAVAVTDSPAHTSYPSSNETDAPSLHSVASSSDTQPSDSDGPFFPPKRTCSDDHLQEAKELVKSVLEKKPAGEKILQEYKTTGKITDSTRRILVNALVGDMIDKYGSIPPKEIRVKYAVGIVTLFPSLKDPFSRKGCEHFYDAEGNSGYIAWRLKTVQRNNRCSRTTSDDKCERRGPRTERVSSPTEKQLEGDRCQEAISFLKHCSDLEQVTAKMKSTFQYRQKMIQVPEKSSSVLSLFPRFLDTKGLVLQDFELLFGVETASKLLEKWDCTLKQKVIQEAKNLTQSPLLSCLIQSAENCSTCQEDWDCDMSSLLLLVYLLPPPSSGNKKFVKISVREALDRVVRFHKSCCSFEEVLGSTQTTQPYILAVGTSKSSIHDYYIAVDKWLIPCMAKSSLSAFDELFKNTAQDFLFVQN
ncbi:Phosphoribosylaminoimidazole-succinocarboxamide synthase [Labeo rohita]|uniref:Phosphoribosylaminoimidazole-succinocarboxamide synthase n=1 Tax=Labeo rohita TaxID=84645 RepID=A0ABQ8N051_LABRO|nr:Phosphoribosylaminoimidazole-succinocarboxamide synthase [Labeo rohita]